MYSWWLSPGLDVAAHAAIAADKAISLQFLKQHHGGTLPAAGQVGVGGETRRQAVLEGIQLGPGLSGANIRKLGLLSAQHLLDGVAGQVHLPGDPANGLAVALIGAADLADGFHVSISSWHTPLRRHPQRG